MASIRPPTALIFGCGYLGIRVARRLVAEGWMVAAVTRSRARARQLESEAIQPIIGDWVDGRTTTRLPPADRVLFAVGYDARSRHNRHTVYVEGLRRALEAIPPTASTVYVSSTGVYHQEDEQWVDERSPTHPKREGGRAHLRAEALLRRNRMKYGGGRDVVLRMAGLYGPGRVPRSEAIRRGECISADGDSYLNLIHIDDAARCVMTAWEHPAPQSLYVVADGHPVRRGEYYREAARILGIDEPAFDPPTTGPSGGNRSDSNKRIWTARLRRDLMPRLLYPTYRHGLRAILAPSKTFPSVASAG